MKILCLLLLTNHFLYDIILKDREQTNCTD